MTAAAVTKEQIKAIHTLKSRARLDDDTYRAFLERETGKRSSKALTRGEAALVIDRLKGSSTPRQSVADNTSKRGLSGPYAAKLQALWISAWHLGLVRDRKDSALIAFVKRQTGIDHVKWVREPADASRAIEGLKAWLAREGGVRWGDHPDEPKRCVVEAQLRRLGEPFPETMPDGANLDGLMAELGEELRARRSFDEQEIGGRGGLFESEKEDDDE